jgi:2-dehydropantoate 2-reductase
MRKNRVAEILPVLAANKQTPNILFLMNNAAGPGELLAALGNERVLIGFPMAAGSREGHVIRYLAGTRQHPRTIPIGEPDGRITDRARQVAAALSSMAGYNVEIRDDMDAWLKTHVALLMPSIAAALYAAGTDRQRLARTQDALVLAVRAVREGFHVLTALGVPITPAYLKLVRWIPEPLLVVYLKRLILRPEMEVALVGHARAARDEVLHLVDEFLTLERSTPILTPAIDRLYPYLDPATPAMREGRAELRLHWRSLEIGVTSIAAVIALAWLRRMYRRAYDRFAGTSVISDGSRLLVRGRA